MSLRFHLSLVFTIAVCLHDRVKSESCRTHVKFVGDRLATSGIREIAAATTSIPQLQELFNHIAIPRPPGSDNFKKVSQYVQTYLRDQGWTVELDTFTTSKTPRGEVNFINVIATRRLLVDEAPTVFLACHLDSKDTPHNFVGATDSAVSCAMLLDLAHWVATTAPPLRVNLGLIFFDGEEAYNRWTKDDSLYGSRHLAQQWSQRRTNQAEDSCRKVDNMSLMILLDLIGGSNPKFYSYYADTQREFDGLRQIENILPHDQRASYFQKESGLGGGGIGDDHWPFAAQGVPVLHLIPSPFPPVWHTLADDADHVDWPTVVNLQIILKTFLYNLAPHYQDV